MGENIKKFIQAFDEFAKSKVDFADQHLKEFKVARGNALELKAPVNNEYKTLGELVAKIFQEDGVFNDNLFRNLYANLALEKSDKDIVSQLYQVKNAPIAYQKALDFQKIGGEAYFNEIASALGRVIAQSGALGSKSTFDKIIGTDNGADEKQKISDFRKVIDILEDEDGNNLDVPTRLAGSALYYAIVENGNPVGKKEEIPTGTPINQTEAKKESVPTTTSAVNPEKATTGEKTEVQKTEGQVTASAPEVPKELEKPQKTPININLEAPATVAPSSTSTTSSTTNVVNQSTATSVANESKEQVTQSTTNISPSTANVQSTNQTNTLVSTSQINDASTKKTITEGAKNLVTSSAKNITSQFLELGKKFGLDQSSLVKLGSATTINPVLTEEAKKGENEVTKEEKVVSLNEPTSKESKPSTETTAKSASINEPTSISTSTGKYDALLAAAKQFGINTEKYEINKTSTSTTVSEPEGNTEITTSEKSALPKPMEVTKSMVSLPTEPKPSVSAQPKASEQLQTTVSATEKAEPASPAPVKEEARVAQPTPAASSAKLDLTSLENRLMRIEYLLSNTLEVKIID